MRWPTKRFYCWSSLFALMGLVAFTMWLVPPWRARAHAPAAKPAKPPLAVADIVVLNSDADGRLVGADGFIPLHFRGTHRVDMDGTYRWAAFVRSLDGKATFDAQAFPPYQGGRGSVVPNENACALKVPGPGEYMVYVELRDLRPVVSADGEQLIDDHLGLLLVPIVAVAN
jgi:hypothetical protein